MEKTRYEEMREATQRYHQEHPEVWDMFVVYTKQMIGRGYDNYSAKAVFERIRWEMDAGGDGVNQFKVGNNHPAFYARRFMRMYPQYNGFFRLRKQTSHERPATDLPEITPNDLSEERLTY